MKTFFVTAYLGEPHGSAKSARDFARALLAVHDDVHIVSPLTEDFGTVAAGHNLSAPVWHRYPRRNAKGSKWPRVLSSARNVFRRMGIRRAMGGQIVIVNGWASYAYWKELAVTGYKSASIIVRESPRHFLFGEHSVSLDEMLAAFSRFDSLVFVSGRTRESWKSFPCLAEKPTFTLPNCCEEEEIECLCQSDRQEARHRAGFSDGDFVVICPGHIEKRKGHDMVLDILPELVSDIPNLCLVM
jgi:glycosyltransferase involved in cell wall biosynthesis